VAAAAEAANARDKRGGRDRRGHRIGPPLPHRGGTIYSVEIRQFRRESAPMGGRAGDLPDVSRTATIQTHARRPVAGGARLTGGGIPCFRAGTLCRELSLLGLLSDVDVGHAKSCAAAPIGSVARARLGQSAAVACRLWRGRTYLPSGGCAVSVSRLLEGMD
jgi:hypothetical protein